MTVRRPAQTHSPSAGVDRITWSEARLCGLPRLTPSLAPRPDLAEAVWLMPLAAAIDDPSDIYDVPNILG